MTPNPTSIHTGTHIGTSGIALPGNKSSFPEQFRSSSRLKFYSSIFNTLEINSSFYKLPQAKTFTKWVNDVTDDFNFSVKLSQSITHAKELNIQLIDINNFIAATKGLNARRGALLIQFPPSVTVDYFDKVLNILHHLRSLQTAPFWKLAVEVRHNSWYTREFYNALRQHHAALVYHDMPSAKTPLDHTANEFIYLRFHGPLGNYKGSYEEKIIEEYSQHIRGWQRQDKSIFVYFNNTMGDAYNNALKLYKMLKL